MYAKIDHSLCIVCGICESDLPEVFVLGNSGFAEVIMEPIEAEFADSVSRVAGDCPVNAILVDENTPQVSERIETATAHYFSDSEEAVEYPTNHLYPERKTEMKTTVNADLCIACGICEGMAPEVFSLETEPYAVVLMDPVPEEFQDAVRESAEACAVEAILIEE